MALTGQIVMGQAIMVKSSEVRLAPCPTQLTPSAQIESFPAWKYKTRKDEDPALLEGHGGLRKDDMK